MWGTERLKQLEAVLQDIDITNNEYLQFFSEQGLQFWVLLWLNYFVCWIWESNPGLLYAN